MVDTSTLPSDIREPVLRELGPDEQLRWFGQPRAFAFILGTLPAFLFAIPWTGFALFWTYAAASFSIPDFSDPGPMVFFPLFGLPFILIGFGLLSTPLFALRRASRTAYLITNKRAVIMDGGRRRTITSIPPEHFGNIIRREGRSGRGDILFGGDTGVDQLHEAGGISSMNSGQTEPGRRMAVHHQRYAVLTSGLWGWRSGMLPPAFINIENPREVEDLLRTMAGSSW